MANDILTIYQLLMNALTPDNETSVDGKTALGACGMVASTIIALSPDPMHEAELFCSCIRQAAQVKREWVN